MDVQETTKQIFALRKEGKLEEALQLARPLLPTYADDEWVVKALGWTLYDCIKKEQRAGKLEDAKQYASELQQLGITIEKDEILFNQSEYIFKTLRPEFKELEKARALSKQGHNTEAAAILKAVIKNHPTCTEAKISLGWELYRLIKDQPDLQQAIALLRKYATLHLNAKPDKLHSLFLSFACKRAEEWPEFNKFVKWWNIELLMYEDWQASYGKDGSGPYSSVAEKLAAALYKNSKSYHKRGPEHQWMLPFVKEVVEKTDSEWAPYYLAKMTLWFKADITGVKELLIPIVKTKQREFWAWQVLAECTLDISEKMAFYSRAVLSSVKDEDYKVDLYHQFALFLAQTNEYLLASLVARRHIAIQEKKGKALAPDIVNLQQAAWFDNQLKGDLTEKLQPLAEKASSYLFKDQPWTSANFIGLIESKDKRPPLTLLLLADKGECKMKNRCAPSDCPEPGAAILVKLFQPPDSTKPLKPGEPPHRPPLCEIYDWKPRPDGILYDCAKQYYGVVSQINKEKGFARASLSSKSFSLLHFDAFPESQKLELGDVVIIWANDLRLQNDDLVHTLKFNKEVRHPVKGLYREFEGRIDIRDENSFGFVRGTTDVFVSPSLVSNHHLVDNMNIKGWALREWNKKKGLPGWSALTIDITQE